VDYIDGGILRGVFEVTHKKDTSQPSSGLDPSNPQVKKIQDLLTREINPAIASHGGFAELLGVKDNQVYLRLAGGCQGCGMADVTLKQGIELRIKEEVPEIVDVIDQTNHAGGTNPYFQP
jgi:Fe/S biogenesis protein NfuA